MTNFSKVALACTALFMASGAFAQKAGDNIVSAGLASINPDTQVGQLTNSGVAQAAVNGATAKVSSETTLSLSWLHMYTDNVGAEVTIGIPPTMTQDLTTPATGAHPGAAKIQLRSPAVVAKYFFGSTQDQWRPYLGLGVAHVSFHKIQTNAGDATIQNLSGNGASLSSSWTPVYNVGVIYNIDDRWSISGSVAYLPVKTTATFVGRAPYGSTTGEVKLNTTDYVVRVGYRF
ncbi:membrane protein [Limnohabitans sp. TEGF004]|nr:membrane protein [Limnohabitans sp. TEGF004]